MANADKDANRAEGQPSRQLDKASSIAFAAASSTRHLTVQKLNWRIWPLESPRKK